MQRLIARNFLRSLFLIVSCLPGLMRAQDIDSAQLGSSIGILQSQLDVCCASIDAQEGKLQSCCDELRKSLNSLQAQFECTTEPCCVVKLLTDVSQLNDVETADWSHDGRYIAIGLDTKVNLNGGDSIDPKVLKIYELVGSSLVLRAETSIGNQIGEVTVVRWHPTKYRLAVGRSDIDDSDECHLHIYDFNPLLHTLTDVDHAEKVDVYAVAWRSRPVDESDSSSSDSSSSSSSSDEEYILAVGRAACNKSHELVLYSVDQSGSLSKPFPSKGIDTDGRISNKALDWDATSHYLVVGLQLSSDNKALQVYEFNEKSHSLNLNAKTNVQSLPGHSKSKATVLAVDWNPSSQCKHLIAVGLKSCAKNSAEQLVQVFEHDGLAGTLCYRAGIQGLKKSVYSVNWKDCKCFALGKSGSAAEGGEFRVYNYDVDSGLFSLESSFNNFKNKGVQEVRWSPNGEFILNGSDNNKLSVYNSLFECKKLSFCDLLTQVDVIQDKVCSILSKVCALECGGTCVDNCCSKIDVPDCCSIVDIIDLRTQTILSKVCSLETNLEDCCESILSKLDAINISKCDVTVPDCCSVVDVIDARTETILSKLCILETAVQPITGCCNSIFVVVQGLPTCCSKIDVIDEITQTTLSKIDELEQTVETCCSVLEQMINNFSLNVELDFQTTYSLIHDAQFTLCSKIENINIPVMQDCCSQVEVIDQRTATILSKVCDIDQNVETCCSVLEQMVNNFSVNVELDFQLTLSAIHDAQFTLCSKIENIDFSPCCDCIVPVEKCCFSVLSKVDLIDSKIDNLTDCCSQVEVIDNRTFTILSKVCEINNEIETISSKIDGIECTISFTQTINNNTTIIQTGTVVVDCEATFSSIQKLQFTIGSQLDIIEINQQIGLTCCSKIEQIVDQLCTSHIQLKGSTVVISAPGSYQLCGNVSAIGTVPAITINASNVKLDLQQFSVQGVGANSPGIVLSTGVSDVEIFNGVIENIVTNDGTGIYAVLNNSDITIHDVTIRNWKFGGLFQSINRLVMENVTVSNCSNDGISVVGNVSTCQDIDVQNIKLFNNTYNGITLQNVNNVEMRDCVSNNNGYGIIITSVEGLRVDNTQFNNNGLVGVFINALTCGNFINCSADRNGMDGFQFLNPSTIVGGDAEFRDCSACGNGGNGFNEGNISHTQFFNCNAESNTGDGFVTADANGSVLVQNCRSQGNSGIGYHDVQNADHHLYLANSSCDNAGGNFDISNNLAVINGPNNARGFQNVDCTITTTDEVPIILSKVCQLQNNLATCCSVIESLLQTVTSSVCPNIIQLAGSGVVINNPGNYVLCNNLLGSSPALIVTASNVHVNLNNFSVLSSAPGQPGIVIAPGVSNVQIFGGFVQNTTPQASLLTTDFGVSITGGNNTDIYFSDVIITGYYNGIVMANNVNNVIMTNVQINNCANDGIDIGSSQAVAVSNCVINNNGNAGINLDNTGQEQIGALRGITFNNVQVSKCTNYGIITNGAQDVSILNSLFFNNVNPSPQFLTTGYGGLFQGSSGLNLINCSFNINDVAGLVFLRCGGAAVEACIFNGNGRGQTPATNPGQNMGTYAEDSTSVSYTGCVSNANNGEGFSAQSLNSTSVVVYTDCISQQNSGAGYREQDAGYTGSAPSNRVYYYNCVAQDNKTNFTISPNNFGNGFSMEGTQSQVYIQGCKSTGNDTKGFNDAGLPTAPHVYFANTACQNMLGNYTDNIGESLTSGQVQGPNNALAFQNVDCSITTTNTVPSNDIIISLIDNLQVNVTTCCSEIEQLINNFSINVAIDFATTNSAIENVQFTLCSKIENLVFPDCCSQVDVIDHRTATILSNISLVDIDLKTCCSVIESLIMNSQFTIDSKIDQIKTSTCPVITDCCSQVDVIDQRTATILSKVCLVDTDLKTCCSVIESLIINSQFTIDSKIDQIKTSTCPLITDCCSQVDVIDRRTSTILSKVCLIDGDLQTCCSNLEALIANIPDAEDLASCCSVIESLIVNSQFTIDSKIDQIRTTTCVNLTVNIPDCCSQVDVIDHRSSTILSKVDLIDTDLKTCCSAIESLIVNAQFTIDSKIDQIRTTTCVNLTVNIPDCCSQVDVIDHRTSTILSKVDVIDTDVKTCCSAIESLIYNGQFTIDSKIDLIRTPTCVNITINLPDCCSQVDVIDHRSSTILSKVDLIDTDLKTCCSVIESLIMNSQFTIDSKIDQIKTSTCPVITDCCSQVDVIDHRSSTILSKVDLIDTDVKTCCSVIESLIVNSQFTIDSKIDLLRTPTCVNVTINLPDCCSQVDVIDHRTSTILSKVSLIDTDLKTCCSAIESLIVNAQFTIDSKIDQIRTGTCPSITNCCSQVDVIDRRSFTILSKVCQIDPDLKTCCSVIDSLIVNSQFTVNSKIDKIQFNNCCSQIDALDKNFKTCCSVIESLITTVTQTVCANKVVLGNNSGTITLSQSNTSYILCGNVTTSSPAIVILASNLRVDLNQFGVISTTGCNPGIVFGPGVQNVELFNGIIQSANGCDYGISATGGGNANINLHDMIIRGWESAMIFANDVQRVTLNNITISDCTGDGISMDQCKDVSIQNCSFLNSGLNGCHIFDSNPVALEPFSRHIGFFNCSFAGNALGGLAIENSEDVRCEGCLFDGNGYGVQAQGLQCGNFIDCSASGNFGTDFDQTDADGFRFLSSELNETEINMANCTACNNACNGFKETNQYLFPQFVAINWLNCNATNNFCNGFLSESTVSNLTVQGCNAYDNGFKQAAGYGFADTGLAGGATTHLYLSNSACRNIAGNYDANVYALNAAVINGPNNARGVQNVDCLITTSDEIPEILSKVCLIESQLEECCASLRSDIEECCADIASNIDSCCEDLRSDIESCCDRTHNDLASCCDQLHNQIATCCDALQNQIATCCDEILCKLSCGPKLECTIDDQILTKVCDIYDCVIDVDSCDKVICLKDRVKTILKKVCTIESKIDAIDLCENVTINVTCDIDETILAKVCLLDIKADEIYKKIDSINCSENSCKTKLIMCATTICSPGTYCLGASLSNQDIKVDLGAASSVVLDLNGYIIDEIKISSDKSAAVKNLLIKNGKAVSNITTDSKHGLNNASLQLENVSAQNVNLVKAKGVSFRANGYIESFRVAGSQINADLEGSVVRNLNVLSHSKDITVKGVRVVDNATIHPETQFITFESVSVGIDSNGGDLVVDNAQSISLNKVSARSISFCNACKNCLARECSATVGGFKIFSGENIVCIDCVSNQNGSGAGFSSSASIATTFENCSAAQNEDGFVIANDKNATIVRCTAKSNAKNGFKDRECMGSSVSECQATNNGLNGFNYTATSNKASSNPTAYYLNYAAANAGANYSTLSSVSSPVRLLTEQRQYGDNLTVSLP